MAEEPSLEIEDSGKSKKKLIIIIAVVVITILGGVGYLFLSGGLTDMSDKDMPPSEGESLSSNMGSALYVAMPRPFIFNVPGSSRDRIVQIKVQLLVRGSENEETAKKHIPLIEGSLLNVFSTTTADELSTSAGKETLRFDALESVQKALENVEGNKVVERVLFTGFVMQ